MSRASQKPLNFEALADFRYAIRRYLNFSERNARKAGLEPQQYQALLAIRGLEDTQSATIGVLAERLQIQHHSAVELMDRLEKRGMIRRHRSRSDRRKVLVELTKRGEAKLMRISLSHRDELQVAGRKLLRALEGFISHNESRSAGKTRGRG
jgi:DNA-binding MarR family transcriptional regulator